MALRKYPGSPLDPGETLIEVPELNYSFSTAPSAVEDLRKQRRNRLATPEPVIGMMSKTSGANKCFVHRNNSRAAQAFLLNYAYIISSSRVLSGEI